MGYTPNEPIPVARAGRLPLELFDYVVGLVVHRGAAYAVTARGRILQIERWGREYGERQ